MKNNNIAFDVILSPVVTEKSTNLNALNKLTFKVSKNESSKFILKSLNLGHYLALKNSVSGIINCPIDKKLLNKKEFGVTEYLANKCKVNNDTETMLIWVP